MGYVWRRFHRHQLAMAGVSRLAVIFLLAIFAPQVAPYALRRDQLERSRRRLETWNLLSPKNHLFGTDLLGRDYFSRVHLRRPTSLRVALVVAVSRPSSASLVGAVAGYFGGVVDNLLMRFTDLS